MSGADWATRRTAPAAAVAAVVLRRSAWSMVASSFAKGDTRRATREQAVIYLPTESFLGTFGVAMARQCHQNHGL